MTAALPASAALAQTLGQAASDAEVPWWRVILALVVGIALAAVAAAALKARMRGGPISARALLSGLLSPAAANRRLQAIETLRLGPQLDVHLFRCDDREVMVASTPSTVVLLGERPAEPVAQKAE